MGQSAQVSFHIWVLAFLCARVTVAMKLMGLSKLSELLDRAGDELDGAACAFAAEIEAATWRSMAEIQEFYPSAVIKGTQVRILLKGPYRVDLVVSCELQLVLVEHAGVVRGARASNAGSKVA